MQPMIRSSLVSCLAILAAASLASCSGREEFLAGEDTPVWLAEKLVPDKPVTYTRLKNGLVKQALDYWEIMKTSDGFPLRKARSVDNVKYVNTRNINPFIPTERNDTEEKRFVAKRSMDIDVVYPSILLVVDYDYFHPMPYENMNQVIVETIIYVLSFWNSVDIELRRIQNPRVPLRISGIVITRDHKASPYINEAEYYYSLVLSLRPMLAYWIREAKDNPDFPLGSFNIVAHMTDANPHRDEGYSIFPGMASLGAPCSQHDGVAGVLVYDDFAFLGIHTAVDMMTKVFGDYSVGWFYYDKYYRKKWTQDILDTISAELSSSSGACMSELKEHHPPGKPVVPVLAGELLPRAKQCEASGFNPDTWHCWTNDFFGLVSSTCEYLKCSNPRTSITCKYSNPTLDGTFCDHENTQICIGGKCVNKE